MLAAARQEIVATRGLRLAAARGAGYPTDVTVPPGSRPSSVRPVESCVTGLVGVLGMEVDDQPIIVLELGSWDPGSVIVVESEPVDEILELTPQDARIENGFDLPVLFAVDDVWRRMVGSRSRREGVGVVRLQ